MNVYLKFLRLFLVLMVGVFFLVGSGSSADKHGETTPGPDNPDLNDSFIYSENSAYSDVLKVCAGVVETENSCSLSKLPLLMQENETPSKEMIMQRVVVSHKWMGDRFSEMLDILDDDIKELLGATTAIIIDDDIKPSFYWSVTGAIYIDPRYLWLTPKEAKTITVKEDYRQNYGNELKFYFATRYIKNNEYAIGYFPLDKNITRVKEDIKYNLARLLYHELAHANDFSTKSIILKADKNESIYNILNNSKNERISSQLYKNSPLSSEVLTNLGQVMYRGQEITNTQKDMEAKELGLLFEEDKSVDMYGYSTQYEDLAMMFESVMMKYHYNLDRDIAFIPKPVKDTNVTYEDYIVSWGKRNRIADTQVSDRALFVVKKLLPSKIDWDNFFATKLEKSKMLKEGEIWWESRKLDEDSSKVEKIQKIVVPKINPMDFEISEL